MNAAGPEQGHLVGQPSILRSGTGTQPRGSSSRRVLSADEDGLGVLDRLPAFEASRLEAGAGSPKFLKSFDVRRCQRGVGLAAHAQHVNVCLRRDDTAVIT
jgi:hypothetical protein